MLVMVLSCLTCLVACGDPENPDGPGGGGGGDDEDIAWWKDITYENTTLLFQMSNCSNNEQLSSGCERLLSGKSSEGKDLDDKIRRRNEDAVLYTNVTIQYEYWPDQADQYGWTETIDVINKKVSSGDSDTPDMYCNFMSDMLTTSLLGSFANLYSRIRGEGDQKGVNFILPNKENGNKGYAHSGYMSDLMSSLTLSQSKIYCIASDYFIDLIRAFFVIPVNRAIYNEKAPSLIDDLNNDGVKDMNDFFVEVENGDWTYDRMMTYCQAAYRPDSGDPVSNIEDRLGFALSKSDGLPASGLLYTTSLEIIKKVWSNEKDDWVYYYPGGDFEEATPENGLNPTIYKKYSDVVYEDVNPELFNYCDKLKELFQTPGVAIAEMPEVRDSFTNDMMLFGGVVLVGSLEYDYYQNMENGFGVVPLPVYREGDKYQTQIHTIGRCGGISHRTTKFAQCTAFVQYQSTHSAEIRDEYYQETLVEKVSGGITGNKKMLTYIRANVRTAFDKLFEDANGLFYKNIDGDSQRNRWHQRIMEAEYQLDMRGPYSELVNSKQSRLLGLENEYNNLPD